METFVTWRGWRWSGRIALALAVVGGLWGGWSAEPTKTTRAQSVPPSETWEAGAAKVEITPEVGIWMSGYGHRNKPSEGKLTGLWAKALVIQDPAGRQVVLVTMDLIGIDRKTGLEIRKLVAKNHRLRLQDVVLSTSHTHTGPVVGDNLKAMYALDDAQWEKIRAYNRKLVSTTTTLVGKAFADLAAAKISWAIGTADFAVNRRNNPEKDVPRLRQEGKLKGPVDHDVPVLQVLRGDSLRAVVVGYACHATVLSFYKWSGDYPGFAQVELEERHPGAIAMFWAGCGGDQNPLPRREVELAKQYGRQLATAVDNVLAKPLKPLDGTLATAYDEIQLSLATLPSVESIRANLESEDRFERGRARHLIDSIERDGGLAQTYPYPVQTWRLGDQLLFVFLGGEVVVDYSLRLKRELGRDSTWIAAYCNDVMAYIPSLRVLREGGYEGKRAMLYYGLPTHWAESVEEDVVRAVRQQAATLRKSGRIREAAKPRERAE